MCMPNGTRHASTHTVQVFVLPAPAPIGTGNCSAESIVAQSIPSAPMMCVPNVTVPERTAVPPELRKVRVTSSHQRWAVGLRAGAPQLRAAGVVAGAVVGGEDCGGALLRPDLAPGGEEAGAGVLDVGPGVVPVSVPEVPFPAGDLGSSSGTSVTLPVGRAVVADDGRGGPTAA